MDARANKKKTIDRSKEDLRIKQKRKFENPSILSDYSNFKEINERVESTAYVSNENNGVEDLIKKKKNKKNKHTVKSVVKGERKKIKDCDGGKGSGEDPIESDGVVVSGKNIHELKYAALRSFDSVKLPVELLECCNNFTKPSPIQAYSWPFLLDGRDLIGIAATGSGKTLAFGIPAIMHVLNKRKSETLVRSNPLVLVLSPTRELAQQIFSVLSKAGKPTAVRTVCIYGGTSKKPQISSLKLGVEIIICTPGRLKDLIEMGVCCLKDVSFVVLDEADRMLDMGFEQEVRYILNQTCTARQMAMFSATWPQPVNLLSQEFMDADPVKVVVGSEDLTANHDVMQIVEVLFTCLGNFLGFG